MTGSLQNSEVFLLMHMQAFQVLDYPERLRKLLVSLICCCLVAPFSADSVPKTCLQTTCSTPSGQYRAT